MGQRAFINSPVGDLQKSKTFSGEPGYGFGPNRSDHRAAALKLDGHNRAMPLTHEKFGGFTDKPLPYPLQTVGMLVSLRFGRKAQVDAIIRKALAAGGSEPRSSSDHGFIHQRTFADPGGHRFGPFWSEPPAMPED